MLKHKILLVDDEQNILNSLSRLLRQDDREIYAAGDANEAWDKLKSISGADLIISDNKLPAISGIDFLTKVKQSYPDTIRMLLTGYPDLESALKAINNGQLYRFITKPWENEDLKLIVRQGLEYYDILKDNRVLLNIAKQQADTLANVQKKYQLPQNEFTKAGLYIIDEQKVSETLSEFLKKYYPGGAK